MIKATFNPKKNGEVYEVFGRHKQDGHLSHLGCVYALNDQLAKAQAYSTYSEKPWVELCCIRNDNILSIISANKKSTIGFA